MYTSESDGSVVTQKACSRLRIIRNCSAIEVWNHWKEVEGFSDAYFRWDIRGKLPSDITGYVAQIEEQDLEDIFIISAS